MYDVYCLGIGAEKPGKIYNGWTRISVKDYDNLEYEKVYGLDFGMVVPTSLTEIKFDGDNTIYVRQKIHKELNMMKWELSKEIEEYANVDKNKDIIVADPNNKDEINKLRSQDYEVFKANKKPGSVISTIKTMMSLRVVICEDSYDIWDEYLGYAWKFSPKGENLEEPVKKDDHSMDSIRYGASYIVNLMRQ